MQEEAVRTVAHASGVAPRRLGIGANQPATAVQESCQFCRPDLVTFVNGLPLVVSELKKPGASARAAFDENLTHATERMDT